jgi:hypothetical protein
MKDSDLTGQKRRALDLHNLNRVKPEGRFNHVPKDNAEKENHFGRNGFLW